MSQESNMLVTDKAQLKLLLPGWNMEAAWFCYSVYLISVVNELTSFYLKQFLKLMSTYKVIFFFHFNGRQTYEVW